ncbi:MAG: hypothetical protein MUO43_17450 [Desulfobacterales bacterium]|nr:hypothetical protein [Desulfobacterales bacterium]
MAKETKKPSAQPGFVVIEEDIYFVFDDEPSANFYNAHENFMKRNFKAAASQLRKAAAFVKLESARATADGKKLLVSYYRELEKLAQKVENGTVASVKDLEVIFSKTHQALAKHHYLKAVEAEGKKNAKAAGRFLKSAVTQLEYGFFWAGHNLEAAALATVKDIRILSGELIEGAGWVPDKIGSAIKWIGKEVEKLGNKIEGKQ